MECLRYMCGVLYLFHRQACPTFSLAWIFAPAGTPISAPSDRPFSMPRIASWRVVKPAVAFFLCSSVILPVIWLALPFPPISLEERATYIQTTLSSGQPVVAAWDINPFRETNQRALDPRWCSDCTSVLFHWQFLRLYGKTQILLAPHVSYQRDRPFELAGRFYSAQVWNEDATGSNKTWSPYFADLWPVLTTVPAGREDKLVSQGWFHEVDRHLIQHTLAKSTTDVDVRGIIPKRGVVEFWRGAAIDRAFDYVSDGWADQRNKSAIFEDHTWTPKIYRQMRHAERDIDLVASFEASERANVADIVVRELKGDLPSRTWALRQSLILQFSRFIVGPVMLFKAADDLFAPYFGNFLIMLFLIHPIYIILVCCSWASAGYPGFIAWASIFWMTRFLIPRRWRKGSENQHIWGPSGPVKSASGEDIN